MQSGRARDLQPESTNGAPRAPFSLSPTLGHNNNAMTDTVNPCRRHDCHTCCVDTRMTLTEADISRLESVGFSDFARENRDGDLELRNSEGRCVFLEDGRCGVYHRRPDGCRLYPLVLDLGLDRVVRDDFCPHQGEFSIDPDRAARLRRSVARETAEAAKRRRRNSG